MADRDGVSWVNVKPRLESPVDVLALRYAYLYLLGREPEDEARLLEEAATQRAAHTPIASLREAMLTSDEFCARLASLLPPAAPASEANPAAPSMPVAPAEAGFGPGEVLSTLALFAANSAGRPDQLAPLALQGAGRIFPLLVDFLASLALPLIDPVPIEAAAPVSEAALRLKALFDAEGSDKATAHDYHLFYAAILRPPEAVRAILEIGLGTNNTEVVSNMGTGGRPGASLRAFRAYCPNAIIYGADVDRAILFEEERIFTHFVDQTDGAALATLGAAVPDGLDLVIDDGLHAPHANLGVLRLALAKLRPGGWAVIEDISEAALPFWRVLAALLPPRRFRPVLLRARGGFLFAVRRES